MINKKNVDYDSTALPSRAIPNNNESAVPKSNPVNSATMANKKTHEDN